MIDRASFALFFPRQNGCADIRSRQVEIGSKYYLRVEMKASREMARDHKRIRLQSANTSRGCLRLVNRHFG